VFVSVSFHFLTLFLSGNRRNDQVFIPQILNKIIQLLLEEEREAEAMQEGTAPCIEFFLQSRVLERLCNLAYINKPAGMFQWIINAIARIIQHMKSPLLAHSSMHKPLVRLLSMKPNKLSFEEKIEVIKLITSLAHKLKEAPIFLKLFWSSEMTLRSYEPSTTPTMSTSPIMTNALHAQEKVASLSTLNKKHFVLFKILDRIYRGSGSDRRLAEQVRRCILSCIVIDDNNTELHAYLVKQVKFLQHTMNELGKLYATLARETYNGNPNANGYLQEYFRQLQFCSALCKIDFSRTEVLSRAPSPARGGSQSTSPADPLSPEYGEFSRQVAHSMKAMLFTPILLPGLLSDDIKLSNINTIFVRETLLQLDAPELSGVLITCLIGPSEQASSQTIRFGDVPFDPLIGVSSGHVVQEALISRIEYHSYTFPLDSNAKKSAVLAANTMRLFSTLFQFHPHNLYVAHHLLFKNLPLVANPQAHLRAFHHPSEAEELNPERYAHALDSQWPLDPDVMAAAKAIESLQGEPGNIGERFEELLQLAPLARQTGDSGSRPDVQTYHDYIKLRFKLARPYLLSWSSHPLTPEKKFPPPFIPEKKNEFGGIHAVSAGNGVKVLDHESAVEYHDTPSWRVLPPLPKDHTSGETVTIRRLLQALLNNLEHFLELPLDFALYLTDTLSSITQYPHAYIHRWSYYPSSSGGESKSIFEILQLQSTKASTFIDESREHMSKVFQFKESAEEKEPQEGQYDWTEEERTAQNVILLDEFCKELLAVLLLVDQVLN